MIPFSYRHGVLVNVYHEDTFIADSLFQTKIKAIAFLPLSSVSECFEVELGEGGSMLAYNEGRSA